MELRMRNECNVECCDVIPFNFSLLTVRYSIFVAWVARLSW